MATAAATKPREETTAVTTTAPAERKSVLVDMANRFGMDVGPFEATLRATVVPNDCSREQFAAFLLVAKEYELNPLLKEIYAFPTKGGGIQPIVGVDGWSNLINSNPAFNGMEFEDKFDDKGELVSITCKIYRKDRDHPISATEYMAECKRGTEPWQKWPRRMLRHKAMIQAARYAFGFAGIVDPDEAERFAADVAKDVTPQRDNTIRGRLDAIGGHSKPAADTEHTGGDTAPESTTNHVDAGPAPAPAKIAESAASPSIVPDKPVTVPDAIEKPIEFEAFVLAKFKAVLSVDELNNAWATYVEVHADQMSRQSAEHNGVLGRLQKAFDDREKEIGA